MQPDKSSRIDTGELKAKLLKKVGLDRFKSYICCLNRFLNQKLSKCDFDKSCYRILGRENLPLHNQIIRVILKNACSAKVPPPVVHEAGVGPTKLEPSVMAHNRNSAAHVLSNGVLPTSPRKVRSGLHDRMLVTPCDNQRPLKRARGLAEQHENEERLMVKKTTDVHGFVRSKDENSLAVVEDGEEVEQLKFSRSPLLAPLGIPHCLASCGGARKALPVTHIGDFASFFDGATLSGSETLRRRMEQIAAVQGVEGVNIECANTLNNMLDLYLKRLIKSCVDLVGARSLCASNHFHSRSGGGYVEEQRDHHSISLLDFKVAMELYPQQLGEDWSLLLEKISTQSFEE